MKKELLIEKSPIKMYCFKRVMVDKPEDADEETYIAEMRLEMILVDVPKRLLSLIKEIFNKPPEIHEYKEFLRKNS